MHRQSTVIGGQPGQKQKPCNNSHKKITEMVLDCKHGLLEVLLNRHARFTKNIQQCTMCLLYLKNTDVWILMPQSCRQVICQQCGLECTKQTFLRKLHHQEGFIKKRTSSSRVLKNVCFLPCTIQSDGDLRAYLGCFTA